jgi:hypothetical protein
MSSRLSEIGDFQAFAPARSVQEITRADGETFVRWAYVTLLGRQADPDGLRFYLRRMMEGKTKVSVLKQISRSPEGVAYGARLKGLQGAIRRAMFKRAPVVGPIYLWLLGANEIKRLSGPSTYP